jgi:hypothetical protein
LIEINDAVARRPVAFPELETLQGDRKMSVQEMPAPQAVWPLEKYVFGVVIALAYAVAAVAVIYPFYMYLN